MPIKFTNKQFLKKISSKGIESTPLEEYRGLANKILFKCSCGKIYRTTPGNVLSGCLCTICGRKKANKSNRKSHKTFVNEMESINSYIEFLSSYTRVSDTIKCRCKKCNYIWETLPTYLLSGVTCPRCGKESSRSRSEAFISKYLKEKNVKYIIQHRWKECRDKLSLPFDFYLPDFNLCLEYDGPQHYKPVERWGGTTAFLDRQRKDEIKNKFCKDNNILLLRIPYWHKVSLESILDILIVSMKIINNNKGRKLWGLLEKNLPAF